MLQKYAFVRISYHQKGEKYDYVAFLSTFFVADIAKSKKISTFALAIEKCPLWVVSKIDV